MNNDNFIGIHTIIIKKPYEYKEALKHANNILKNKILKERQTKTSYRFVNIDKNKFYDKSFRTKKINDYLSIVFGILKPEHQKLLGGGIIDYFKNQYEKGKEKIKNVFIRTDNYNNTTTKNLKEYGDLQVQKLTIYRTPIMKMLDKALNLITMGQFSKLKKEYGFDELFHLALIADVGNKNLVIEKNEVINVNTSYQTSEKTEKMDVDLKGKIFTINQMLELGRKNKGDKLWFLYNPWTNNCQYFIKYCLEAVDLYGDKESEFLFQDITELQKKLNPVAKKIATGITTTGAVFNKLTGKGGSVKGSNVPTDEQKKKNEAEFWRQNELVRKRLNAKTNYENRGFMEERKKAKDEQKQYWNAFYNVLEQQGFDRNGTESYTDFIKRIEETTGYFPFPKKNDPLQWEWKKTKNIPIKLEDFGMAGKILKTIGMGEVATSLLDVYNSGVKMSEKPSLSNALEIGKNLGEAVKGAVDVYKAGPKGIAKETAKNLAKEVMGGKKKKIILKINKK